MEQAELRRDRAEAERSLTLFRTLVDHSGDTIGTVDPETALFLNVNQQGPAGLGYTREEFLKLRLIDIDPTLTDETWRELTDKIRLAGALTWESSHRRKDGSKFPVEFSANWFRQERDYIVAVVRDISERKRTDERFRRLVDSSGQGVVFRRTTGEITGANDAFLKIIGYSREEMEAGGLSLSDLTPVEFAPLDLRCLQELAAVGVCAHYEKEYHRRDGSRVPVLIGAAAFEYDPDESVCFVVDLTDLKNLELRFLRAQRMESIGTLASGIVHDLNNVLAPIMMSVALLKPRVPDLSGQEVVSIIEASAQHGMEMVRQVLSFTRGGEGRRIEVQVNRLILEIESLVNETFLKNIEVRTHLPPDLWMVQGDPTQLHQVLLNLCVNARDAMPSGGTLTLSAENITLDDALATLDPGARSGPYVLIRIDDNGTGMTPEILREIFDPFFTTKEVDHGTGLGLSTSLGIVKNHGGFLQVESEPGNGSKFLVYLPAWSGAAATPTVLAAAMPQGQGELILVVDDAATVREITRHTLEVSGYRVLLASNGAEAVSLYVSRGEEIGLVLIDMNMPVMDGPATIELLRGVDPGLRIIVVSGLAPDECIARIADLGVHRFLTKPYAVATLLGAIRQVLETK
jgi:PAS domain S-box-containing protein